MYNEILQIVSEKTIHQTIRHIEIEELLKSDCLESPILEECSSSNSLLQNKEERGSMEIHHSIEEIEKEVKVVSIRIID